MSTPPAYGLYARKVRGLTLLNVCFLVAHPDLRPAVVMDHILDVAVNGFGAQGNPQAKSLLRFIETSDVLVIAPRVLTPAAAFLQIEGAGGRGITVDGGDLSLASAVLAFAAGTSKKAVKLRV